MDADTSPGLVSEALLQVQQDVLREVQRRPTRETVQELRRGASDIGSAIRRMPVSSRECRVDVLYIEPYVFARLEHGPHFLLA